MLNSRRLVLVIFLLIVSVLCISACGRQQSETPVLSTPTLEAGASITPAPGLAVVKGIFVDNATKKAPAEGTLYLGEIQSMSNGKPVVSLERAKAPYAIPAPSGEFFFQNLEPGKYALIYYTPELNFVVNKPGSNESMIFDVSPDQALDLGKFEVTFP